eukprot:3940096-Rhodomonas_salina.1
MVLRAAESGERVWCYGECGTENGYGGTRSITMGLIVGMLYTGVGLGQASDSGRPRYTPPPYGPPYSTHEYASGVLFLSSVLVAARFVLVVTRCVLVVTRVFVLWSVGARQDWGA